MSDFGISFGSKISLMKSCIINTKKGKKTPVVLSEYDCKDYPEDITNFLNSCPPMIYSRCIAYDMLRKSSMFNFPFNVYVLEDNKKNVIGICETKKINNDINIEYIETKQDGKYKYAGQTMIAMVAKMLSDKKTGDVYVKYPAASTQNFYMKKCGFKPVSKDKGSVALIMKNSKISKFIKEVRKNTGSKIIELDT